MLVLSRKVGEEITIGDGIVVKVTRISGNRVTIGISAPDNVHIVRRELQDLVQQFDEPQGERVPLPSLVAMDGVGAFDCLPHAAR